MKCESCFSCSCSQVVIITDRLAASWCWMEWSWKCFLLFRQPPPNLFSWNVFSPWTPPTSLNLAIRPLRQVNAATVLPFYKLKIFNELWSDNSRMVCRPEYHKAQLFCCTVLYVLARTVPSISANYPHPSASSVQPSPCLWAVIVGCYCRFMWFLRRNTDDVILNVFSIVFITIPLTPVHFTVGYVISMNIVIVHFTTMYYICRWSLFKISDYLIVFKVIYYIMLEVTLWIIIFLNLV